MGSRWVTYHRGKRPFDGNVRPVATHPWYQNRMVDVTYAAMRTRPQSSPHAHAGRRARAHNANSARPARRAAAGTSPRTDSSVEHSVSVTLGVACFHTCEIDLSKWSYDGIRVLGDTRGHARALIHSLWPLLGAVNTLFTVRTMYRGDQVWQRFR